MSRGRPEIAPVEEVSPTTTGRLEYVDVLRGFALFGVLGANLFIFAGLDYMDDAQRALLPTPRLDRIAAQLVLIFVENKFMGLFAALFGVSFWLFLERARARGEGTPLFYRRLGWLFLFGAIHGWLFWCFDILRFYALWGLLLPLFVRVSNKALLCSALFWAILAPALVAGVRSLLLPPESAGPAMDGMALQAFASGSYVEVLRANWVYDWHLTNSVGQISYQIAVLGRLLFGLWAIRTGFLTDLAKHRAVFRTALFWFGTSGISANVLYATHALRTDAKATFFWPFVSRLVDELGFLALSLAYACALALLFLDVRWGGRLRRLAPLGRMALTCFLSQTLIGLWLFYGFMPGPDLMGRIGPAWLVPIWVAVYTLQLGCATWWLRRFRFGPAEWLWRSLTYGRRQPFEAATHAAVPVDRPSR